MRMFIAAAAVAAAFPALAQAQTTSAAQDASGATTTSAVSAVDAPASAPVDTAAPAAPVETTAAQATDTSASADRAPVRRIEPYVAITGGYEWFDRQPNRAGIPYTGMRLDGALIKGGLGVNVALGRSFFAGVEGNVAKGFGDMKWQYGASGRVGIRPDDHGMIYARAGYQWVNFRLNADPKRHYNDWTWGLGAEVGSSSLGLGNMAGLRFRAEVNTLGNFHSFQPTAGLVLAF